MQEIRNGLNELLAAVLKLMGIVFFIIVTVVFIVIVAQFFSNKKESSPEPTQQTSQGTLNVSVESPIVKYVDKKYRYFFYIKNNDTRTFSGDVNIDLISAEGRSVYDQTFSTSEPLTSSTSNAVYFEANTGPVSVHGTSGIKTFSYTVTINGITVKSGSGDISTKLE